MAGSVNNLSSMLDEIKKHTVSHETITFGDIMDSVNRRGFGPLLMVPAVLVMLPTGAIPGMPALCAFIICMVTMQMMLGLKQPWIPARIKKFSVKRTKFLAGARKIRKVTFFIDSMVHPRLEFLAQDPVQRLVACICFVLALVMAFIGFIPMLPAVIALPILFFSLGLSTRDGLLILAGILLGVGTAALIVCLASLCTTQHELTQYIVFDSPKPFSWRNLF